MRWNWCAVVTEVFVSYAREDRETAQALAGALAADGHAVWWDRALGGGDDFSLEIERQLTASRVALVLWSQASVQSGFVRDEAGRARDAGKLLPLRIEAGVPLPLGFGNLHTLELLDWDGDADDGACRAMRDEVRRLIARRARAAQGPVGAMARPERSSAPTPLAWRRWRRPTAAALVAFVVAAGAWWWNDHSDNREALLERQAEAQAHFERGLAAHFDTEPKLEVARNAYLAALRAKADFAPAHFYLAHVYALLQLPADARSEFEAALALKDQLDPPQRADATAQLKTLVVLLAAPPPLVREASAPPAASAPASASASSPAATPAPATPLPPSGVVVAAAPAASAASSAGLTRVPPSEAEFALAKSQASALLGANRQAQVTAATTLALDAGLAAEALPQVLAHTEVALRTQPDAPATREAVAQSLRLLQTASPSLLRVNARAAQPIAEAGRQFGSTSATAADEVQARVARAGNLKPLVFVQIGDERQRRLAQSVVARFTAAGYGAPGIENVGMRAPAQTELRVQGASDPALARWMAQQLARLIEHEVPVKALRQAEAKTDTFEVWFDKDLCVLPTRTPPACGIR